MTLVARLLSICAALILLALTLLTFADVVGRYFFSRPISGSHEVIALMLGLTIFAALPAVTLRNGHITVELLASVIGPGLDRARRAVVWAVSIHALGVLAWVLYRQAIRQGSMMMATPHLGIPYEPVMLALAALSAASALLLGLAGLAALWRIARGERT